MKINIFLNEKFKFNLFFINFTSFIDWKSWEKQPKIIEWSKKFKFLFIYILSMFYRIIYLRYLFYIFKKKESNLHSANLRKE
jgi:hypothetical protein